MTPLERVIALQAREEEARLSHMNNCDLCGEKEAEQPSKECPACLSKLRAYDGKCYHGVDPYTDCPVCKGLKPEWVWRERYAALKVRARYGV